MDRRSEAPRAPNAARSGFHRARTFEAYLARLYVDAEARKLFLADPYRAAERAGLDVATCQALAQIDTVGLELAAHSFAHKRRKTKQHPSFARGLWDRLAARTKGRVGR